LVKYPQNSRLTTLKVLGFLFATSEGFYLLGEGIFFGAERKKGIARG